MITGTQTSAYICRRLREQKEKGGSLEPPGQTVSGTEHVPMQALQGAASKATAHGAQDRDQDTSADEGDDNGSNQAGGS